MQSDTIKYLITSLLPQGCWQGGPVPAAHVVVVVVCGRVELPTTIAQTYTGIPLHFDTPLLEGEQSLYCST